MSTLFDLTFQDTLKFAEYRAYAQDIMAAILVFENNDMAAMLVSQTNPAGVKLFFICKHFLLFQYICMAACWTHKCICSIQYAIKQ